MNMTSGVQKSPTPPPLPPPSKPSTTAVKVKAAPPGWYFDSDDVVPERKARVPPTGLYFLYGTLQDPMMLVEILNLPDKPTLRPAKIVGFRKKLWGQYPALVKEPDSVVEGMVFEVSSLDHAQKLAAYETNNYVAEPCTITYLDAETPENAAGFAYLFVGRPKDLSEGQFDLDVWLTRMGRKST